MTGTGLIVHVQYAASDQDAPPAAFLERCARCVFADASGELVLRIVGESESATLNRRYRGRSGPTNVLAFPPGEGPVPADEPMPLGDIAICAAVVRREALEQSKPLQAHWAHIVIHGCLHLLGFDHMNGAEASTMEARERTLLAGLGIADPYADEV